MITILLFTAESRELTEDDARSEESRMFNPEMFFPPAPLISPAPGPPGK